jgi:hypothetical protein
MNFREAIASIPYAPNQTQATGIVAPIMRATGHILYLVGALAEPGYVLTDEEAFNELVAAQGHLSTTAASYEQAPLSSVCAGHIGSFIAAVRLAHDEYAEWPEEERGRNLKDLADRAASLGSILDLELTGIRSSDPGRTL